MCEVNQSRVNGNEYCETGSRTLVWRAQPGDAQKKSDAVYVDDNLYSWGDDFDCEQSQLYGNIESQQEIYENMGQKSDDCHVNTPI